MWWSVQNNYNLWLRYRVSCWLRQTHPSRMFSELSGEDVTAIYFIDKFREVFPVYLVKDDEPLPAADDILSWISFVAMHCPECHPPEWPADAN